MQHLQKQGGGAPSFDVPGYTLQFPFWNQLIRALSHKATSHSFSGFAASHFAALHSSDGNSAAAFTLDGKTGPHDAHRCWEHGSRIFAQVSRQQGILSQHPEGTRPRRRRLLQNLLPRLPIHFSLSRTPPQTLRRRPRDLSRDLPGRRQIHKQFREGIRNNLSDPDRRRKRLRGLQRLRTDERTDDFSDRNRWHREIELYGLRQKGFRNNCRGPSRTQKNISRAAFPSRRSDPGQQTGMKLKKLGPVGLEEYWSAGAQLPLFQTCTGYYERSSRSNEGVEPTAESRQNFKSS